MDELWDEKDRQFAQSQESFGISLLRQASQRASGLPLTFAEKLTTAELLPSGRQITTSAK